tara:strand:+ start:397 stop:684 length:288 start_codon:yes stop_codon:yes gene_type:complete
MAFDMNGNLSDTIDKAKVFVVVDDSVKPVEVKTNGIYSLKMYTDDYNIGDFVRGTSNNKDKNIIAVGTKTVDPYTNLDLVGRIVGKDKDIAKVLI